jgi:CheY-like chemotaxis protein
MNLSAAFFRRKAKPQILVVEDKADHWFMIRWALQVSFPEVEPVWVSSDTAAIDHLTACTTNGQQKPRLVLLDLYLPHRQAAWNVLSAVKTSTHYRNVPVVMLSYSDKVEDILDSYQLRCNSYLVKPTSQDQWLSCFAEFRRYWWQAVTLPKAD